MTEKDWIKKSRYNIRSWDEEKDLESPREIPHVGDKVLICHETGWDKDAILEALGEFEIVSETPARFKVGPEQWVFEKFSGRVYGSNEGLGYKSKLYRRFDGWQQALENYNKNRSLRAMIYKKISDADTCVMESVLELLEKGTETDVA